MKNLMVLLGAVCVVGLMALYCTDVKFDNPLDEKGNNFLFNDDRYNKEEAIKVNDDGVSGLFDTASGEYFENYRCVTDDPKINLLGPSPVTVSSNRLDSIAIWVGARGGAERWAGVLSWNGEATATVKLTRGDYTDIGYQHGVTTLEEGTTYKIIYTVDRGICPDGETSRGQTTAERNMTIVAPTTSYDSPPTIVLVGDGVLNDTMRVVQNETYVEPSAGSNVSRAIDADGVTVIPFDSIVVYLINTNGTESRQLLVSNTSEIIINTQILNRVYKIRYYATSRLSGLSTSRDRIVKIVQVAGLPTPIIVLRPYRHVINSITIDHPDTAMSLGDPVVYREKGILEVYYISGGTKVNIDTNLVQKPTFPSTTMPMRRSLTYTLPAGPGYLSTTTTRRVIVYNPPGTCDVNDTPPGIMFSDGGGATLSLSASQNTWDVDASWSVERLDEGPQDTYKFIWGSSPALNPNVPTSGGSSYNINVVTLVPGTYTVTYVALSSACGNFTTRQRTVTVNP